MMLMLHHNKNGGFTQIERLAFAHAVRSLEQKGLVRGFWSEESGLVHAVLTGVGETYIYFNPRLKNPVDWKWIISLVVASIAAAFFAKKCSPILSESRKHLALLRDKHRTEGVPFFCLLFGVFEYYALLCIAVCATVL